MTDTAAPASAPTSTVDPVQDRSFFGHPHGLAYLLGAEGGWAFAYYGLQGMLTLYMTQVLLKPGHIEHVIGFSAYRAALQSVFGPLSPLGIASQTFGVATGLIYALPILGGFIADRWTGQRKAAIAGVVILVAAHLLLIREQTFLIALLGMILGTGLLKTALVGQIGRLYAPNDDRRTRGFGLYLIALNTGSFSTYLISGTLGERVGWPVGFIALAVGMTFSAACYIAGVRHTPPDTVRVRRDGTKAAPKLHPGDGRIVAVLILLVVLDGIWSGVYNQAFNVFPVWAEAHVQRRILGFLMPVTWFSTLDGVLTILGTAVAVQVWAWQNKRGGNAAAIGRITIGYVMATAGFLVLALGALIGGAGKAPILPEVLFFLLLDFSIPWIDTVILTLVSRDSPVAIGSTMLGIYYLSTAGGNFLTGLLGGFADKMTVPAFWLMHAAIQGAILVFLLLAGMQLSRLLARRKGEIDVGEGAALAGPA